jgi:hypothetical protein
MVVNVEPNANLQLINEVNQLLNEKDRMLKHKCQEYTRSERDQTAYKEAKRLR